MRAFLQPLEKYLSFGAIGGLIGVCNDIATPLAGSNIYGVMAGVVALVLGFLAAGTLGIRSDITKGLLGVGAIMAALSLFFLTQEPSGPNDGDTGYLASRFSIIEKAQGELVKKLGDIHEETVKIADNTSKIAENTNDLRGFSIDETRFVQALDNGDKRTVALACKSGMRASSFIFHGGIHGRDGPDGTYSDDMVSFLMNQSCVNAEKLCPELFRMKTSTDFLAGPGARFALLDRVGLICGAKVRKQVADWQEGDTAYR
ncbi:hypothetical protein GUK30_32945 [Rhizobium leguminosarum]|uniref:hypothetical protein n=1 Tax=Rhizobium ruizarguesonis TaxID=2081791 RepID=UPI0013BF0E93|nr:hypothetical protein [Rhizobium ruizarguesonis]NEI24155.1 hypothetical protein [Rhizobium ruizarguesonis]